MNRNIWLTTCFVAAIIASGLTPATYAQPAHLHSGLRPKTALKSPSLKKLVYYNLILHTVADTEGQERVWELQLTPMTSPFVNIAIKPPDYVYKSLSSPSLLVWVSNLPPGTSIRFSIGLGPSVILSDGTQTGNLDPKLKSELDAFQQFCKTYKIDFDYATSNG